MRSRYTNTGGIVLRRLSQPNGDALVTLLSPSGKWRALARAGRNSAGNAGRLSLFNDVSVQCYRRNPDDLPVITQVTLNGMLPRLSEPELYPLAHVLAELCDALTVDVHYGEPLYDYLASGLRGLNQSDDPEKVTLLYCWGMLRVAGLAPEADGCGSCGAAVMPVTLDVPAGRLNCADCGKGIPLAGDVACELNTLLASGLRAAMPLPFADRRAHWRLLNRYLNHHVTRLNSSEAFSRAAESRVHA